MNKKCSQCGGQLSLVADVDNGLVCDDCGAYYIDCLDLIPAIRCSYCNDLHTNGVGSLCNGCLDDEHRREFGD